MTSDSKVIAFEKLQARQKQNAKDSVNSIFVQGRGILSQGAEQRLSAFFNKADDGLFRLSERAENGALQSIYFDAMRQLRLKRDSLQESYLRELTQYYDAFWRKQPLPKLKRRDRGEFAPIENDELELAVSRMIEKGNHLFLAELFSLSKRFAFLLKQPEETCEINPVSPFVLCKLFEARLEDSNLEIKLKLYLYKLFEKQVLCTFGPVYHALELCLANSAVFSGNDHSSPIPYSASGKSPLRSSGQNREKLGKSLNLIEVVERLQALLDELRKGLPSPVFRTAAVNGAEVLNALSMLQQPSQMLPMGGAILSGEEMKLFIANQLAKLQSRGDTCPLGPQEEDIIDMVGVVFDYILDDRKLPTPVKVLIARLQIPVLKIALLESSFFAKKNHPARLLLNSLAHAGTELDDDVESENSVYRKIETIVERVLNEFDRNVELFGELLDDFSAFMAKENQRSRVAEERTRLLAQSKEQVKLAKKRVSYVIASRLRQTHAPMALRSFLYNTWKEVLVLAWLRRDKVVEHWDKAVVLVDQLIGCVVSREDSLEQESDEDVQALREAIWECLQDLSLEPNWIAELLQEFEDCCCSCFQYALEVDCAATRPASILAEEINIKDPEIAALITEIKANLPDIENIGVDEVDGFHGEQRSWRSLQRKTLPIMKLPL